MNASGSPIVDYYLVLYSKLKYVSWYELIIKIKPGLIGNGRQFIFVERWVFFNFMIALFALFFTYILEAFTTQHYVSILYALNLILLVYGIIRIVEIVIYQMNVFLFDEIRDKRKKIEYSVRSYRRLIILLLHNYIEIILWFAFMYHIFFDALQLSDSGLINILNFSFATMTSFGFNETNAE